MTGVVAVSNGWPRDARPARYALRLLDRDGLRQVARLIDVRATLDGDVVREQLKRNARQNRQSACRRCRECGTRSRASRQAAARRGS